MADSVEIERKWLINPNNIPYDLSDAEVFEIEFTSKEESNSYQEPDWIIMDVTTDKNYKNGYLARYGIPQSFYNIQ